MQWRMAFQRRVQLFTAKRTAVSRCKRSDRGKVCQFRAAFWPDRLRWETSVASIAGLIRLVYWLGTARELGKSRNRYWGNLYSIERWTVKKFVRVFLYLND